MNAIIQKNQNIFKTVQVTILYQTKRHHKNHSRIQDLDNQSQQQLKNSTYINVLMKSIECENSLQNYDYLNNKKLKFQDIIFGFQYDGMLYQTSTNTSYNQLQIDQNCEPGIFKLDTRCRFWYNKTVNDPFLKIFPPSEFYSDATTPFLASVFCKRNLLNKEVYSVLCYSIKLFQIYDFFQDFNKYSSTQITIDPDTLSLVYHSDLANQRDQNKNDFSDNFKKMEQYLSGQQLNGLNKVRDEITNRFSKIQSERKESISLTELFDDMKYQKTFEYNFDGLNYFAIMNIIKTIDKSKLFPLSRKSDQYTDEQKLNQDGSIGYKIKNTYFFIDILSKEQLTQQQRDLQYEVETKQKPLIIIGYICLAFSFLFSIYQSLVLGRLIDAPIEHLTQILETMRFEDKNIGDNFNDLFEGDQIFSITREKSQSENDSEGDGQGSQQKKLNKQQYYFLSEDMKILFTSFQTLFQTLNFTMQSFFEEKDDEGCQTLLNLNLQAEHFKKFSNFRALGVCYNNMGNIHVNNQRYKEAFQCYQKAVVSSKYELSYYEEKIDIDDNGKIKCQYKQNQDLTTIQSNKLQLSSQNESIDKQQKQNISFFKKIANILKQFKQNYFRKKKSLKLYDDKVKGAKLRLKPYLVQNSEVNDIIRIPEVLGSQQLDYNENDCLNHNKKKIKDNRSTDNDQLISYQQINSKEFTQQNLSKEKDDGKKELYWMLFHRKFNLVKALLTHFLFFSKKGEGLYDGMDYYFEELLDINKKHLNDLKHCKFIVNFYYISLLVKIGEIQKSREKQEENIAIFFEITQGYLENLPINTQLQKQQQQAQLQQQQQLIQQQYQCKRQQQNQYQSSLVNSNEMLQSKKLKQRIIRSQKKKNTLQMYIDQYNYENKQIKKEKQNFTTACLPNPHSLDSLEGSPHKTSKSHQIFKEFTKKNPETQLKYLDSYQDIFYILDQYYNLIRDINNSVSFQVNFPHSASDLETKKSTTYNQKYSKSCFSNELAKQMSLNALDTSKQNNQLFKEILRQNYENQQELITQRKNNKDELLKLNQRNTESSKQLNQQQINQTQYQASSMTPKEKASLQKQNSIFSSYRPSLQQNERLSTFNQTVSNQYVTQRTFTNQFIDQKKQCNSISRQIVNRYQQHSIGNILNQSKFPQLESQSSQKTIIDENANFFYNINNYILPCNNLFKKNKLSSFYMDVDLDQITRYEYTPDLLCGFLIYAETVILCAENRLLESAYIMTDYLEKVKYISRQLKYQIVSRFLFLTQQSIPKLLSPLIQLKNIYDYEIYFSIGIISTPEIPKFMNKSRQLINLILNDILTRPEDQFGLICFQKLEFNELISINRMQQLKQTSQLVEDILNQYIPQSSILQNSSFFFEQNAQDKQNKLMTKQSIRSDQILEQNIDNKLYLFENINQSLQQQNIQDKQKQKKQKHIKQHQDDKSETNPDQQQLVTFECDFMQKSQFSINEFQNPNIKSFVQGSKQYSFTKLKSKCDLLNSLPSINDIDQPLKSYDEKEVDINQKINKYSRQVEARNKQKSEQDNQFVNDYCSTDLYQDTLIPTQDYITKHDGMKESINKSIEDIEVLNSSNIVKSKIILHPESSQIYNQGTQINLPLELISGNEQSNINLIDDIENDNVSNQYYLDKRNTSCIYSEINNSVQTPITHKNQSNMSLICKQNQCEKKKLNKQQKYLNISFKYNINNQENHQFNTSVLEKQPNNQNNISNINNSFQQNNLEQLLNTYEQIQNKEIQQIQSNLEQKLQVNDQKQNKFTLNENKKEQIMNEQEQIILNQLYETSDLSQKQFEIKNQRQFCDNIHFYPKQYGQFTNSSPNKKLSLISSIDEDTSKILGNEKQSPFIIKQQVTNNYQQNAQQKQFKISDDQKFHFAIRKAITSFFCKNNFMNHYLLSQYKKSNKFTDINQDKLDISRLNRKKYLIYITQDMNINQESDLYKMLSYELYNIDLELLILQLNQNESLQEYCKYQNVIIKNKTVIRFFQNEVRLAEYIFNERESKKYKQFPLMYEHYSNNFLLVNID